MKDSDEKMIILVEGKGDVKDLRSKMTSKNEDNRDLILRAMREA